MEENGFMSYRHNVENNTFVISEMIDLKYNFKEDAHLPFAPTQPQKELQ